ncbi:hypothetical protein [Chitinophaga sp. MM2321]|uniref:hypothetical protein n=1 Tax=Chitinophaga sp. MM2321 TaxID=3137178 RepID=UPI0032D5860E
MKQQYEILTAIQYHHTFLPSLNYEGIEIRVPAETSKQLINEGLLLKQQPGGMMLLYNNGPEGSRSRDALLQRNITLTFQVLLKDPLFYNYTQINMQAVATQLFMFSNALSGSDNDCLHRQDHVSEDDLCDLSTLPETFFVKPFGQLVLQLGPSIQSNYYIRFRSKSTYWCYFLMSGQLAELANPAILDINGNACFDKPLLAEIPGKKKVPVFISQQPIPLSGRNPDAFKLVDQSTAEKDKYKIIIPTLPCPDISRISAAGTAWRTNGKAYSEIFLY